MAAEDPGAMSSGNSLSNTYQHVPRPTPYEADSRYSHVQRDGLVLRREKSLNHLHEKMQVLRRNGSSSGTENLGYSKKRNVDSEKEKTLIMKLSYTMNYVPNTSEDEDVCPTCLEGKIIYF